MDCTVGRVILKLDNKNQKLFFCSDNFYVKLNSKKLLLFDQSPEMTRKLVKRKISEKTKEISENFEMRFSILMHFSKLTLFNY